MCDIVNTIPQGEASRRLRVRFARPRDFPRVSQFYKQNQVYMREAHDLVAIFGTSELQRLYIIEDTGDNQIVAAAACLGHCDGRFVELRGAVVRCKGYGLHQLLTHIRTVHTLAMTSSGVSIFCTIEGFRHDLRERMQKLGFEPWMPPAEDLTTEFASRRLGVDDYMKFAAHHVEAHRQALLDVGRAKLLRHVVTGQVAGLSLEVLLNNDPHFSRVLENSAPFPT